MADMLTYNGVPVATYGLTGLMLVFLTGATFLNINGNSDTSATAVATASVPAFIGDMLTPSAPSMTDALTDYASQSMTGSMSTQEGKSTVEQLAESGQSAMNSLTESGQSAMETLAESGKTAITGEKSVTEQISDEGKSLMGSISKSIEESPIPDYIKRPAGGKKKKTRKARH
jgi:hypothetical protein